MNEGAYTFKREGVYYLTYTANHFESIDYAVGYATADNPFGPWTKYENNPILRANIQVMGPGNGMFIKSPSGNENFFIYHTHYNHKTVRPRKLAMDKVWFENHPEGGADIIHIDGPSFTPQLYPN